MRKGCLTPGPNEIGEPGVYALEAVRRRSADRGRYTDAAPGSMIRFRLLLLLGALALPAGAVQAQTPPPAEAGMERTREEGAFQLLLQRRDEIGLSPAQVRRLEAIAERLERENGPLRLRLQEERRRFLEARRAELERMTPEERRAELRRMRERGAPPLPESMRPLAESMRRNIRQAMRQANGVLTPAQRMRVRQMIRGERGGVGRRPLRPGLQRGRGP